ncbi:MAG: phosphoglycerate kinase [Flavobacteriales bacterium]|nr:phosphoglycerate kinase [Flavobacteriales bacterium]
MHIDQCNFSGKRVLLRVDFNVPLDASFNITDDSRMQGALPTIRKILADGGSVVLMSHLGRPKDGPEERFSLKHLVPHLEALTGVPVHFSADCVGEKAKEAARSLQSGEILLLENVRFHPEETKGDRDFAAQLAQLGDAYVNDAFGAAHRAHASTAIVAGFFPGSSCYGYLMGAELENADRVLRSAEKPFTAIVGGAKVSDKLLILENLIQIADNILVGGGMAYTFIKAQGGHIGNSLLEEERMQLTLDLLEKAEQAGVKIYLPQDSIVANSFSNEAETQVVPSAEIGDGWMGLDIGPLAAAEYAHVIRSSRTILWNGPMGVFEMPKFAGGTEHVAHAVVEATEQGAFSLIGGGDSAAAIKKLGLTDQVSYVSTGGGALLEYFEGKTLPGVAALLGENR